MPAGRVSMRHVREVLRLGSAGVSKHEIARRMGLAPSTVRETLKRFAAAGLTWPLPDDVTDVTLEGLLYKNAGTKQGHRRQDEPDWAMVHRDLKRKHVTLSILWDEYIEQHPDGYRYSRFCDLYRSWEGKLSVTMRQAHAGGEKLFVDYACDRAPVVIDRLTGEIREAWIFVAVLGASNFTYAEATWTQGLADWIGAHTRALEAIGGVPRLIVPDNTKTAVIKASLYEPSVNRTYSEMAAHYDTAILPTRPRRPRDKAKVEAAALTHPEWLAPLLDREMTYRHDRKLAARLRYARLRQQALVEDIDYRAARGLDRPLFQKLVIGDWIDAHDNLTICGPTGVGKSWLACALGHKACRDNRSVLYQRVPKLFGDLALARGDGRYARITRALGGVQLWMIGGWSRSMPRPATICWKSWKNAMAADRPSLPASSRSRTGTRSSATRPTPMRSSTASSTTPIASTCPATASGGHDQN